MEVNVQLHAPVAILPGELLPVFIGLVGLRSGLEILDKRKMYGFPAPPPPPEN
jgi:hypothetical protein